MKPFAIVALVTVCTGFVLLAGNTSLTTAPARAEQGSNAVLAAGRSVASLIQKRNADALYARFTKEMAAQVSKEQLADSFQTLVTRQMPLGPRLDESVETGKDGLITYTAEHYWKKKQNLVLTVRFVPGSGGKIAGMTLRPAVSAALPPDPKAGYRLQTPLHLPFAPGDEWVVVWGGDTRAQNYHVDSPDQRHAYDLLAVKDDKTHSGDGTELTQYYAYGRNIVAPAPGKVVEAVNELPDNKPGVMDPAHAAGNHILLSFGNGEYALLAHLQKGSVRVKAGDTVVVGQVLGLCGNSGNTSEPHLHFHVQDKPYLFRDALGLPVTFIGYISNGAPMAKGTPVQGEMLRTTNAPEAAHQEAK